MWSLSALITCTSLAGSPVPLGPAATGRLDRNSLLFRWSFNAPSGCLADDTMAQNQPRRSVFGAFMNDNNPEGSSPPLISMPILSLTKSNSLDWPSRLLPPSVTQVVLFSYPSRTEDIMPEDPKASPVMLASSRRHCFPVDHCLLRNWLRAIDPTPTHTRSAFSDVGSQCSCASLLSQHIS